PPVTGGAAEGEGADVDWLRLPPNHRRRLEASRTSRRVGPCTSWANAGLALDAGAGPGPMPCGSVETGSGHRAPGTAVRGADCSPSVGAAASAAGGQASSAGVEMTSGAGTHGSSFAHGCAC